MGKNKERGNMKQKRGKEERRKIQRRKKEEVIK